MLVLLMLSLEVFIAVAMNLTLYFYPIRFYPFLCLVATSVYPFSNLQSLLACLLACLYVYVCMYVCMY